MSGTRRVIISGLLPLLLACEETTAEEPAASSDNNGSSDADAGSESVDDSDSGGVLCGLSDSGQTQLTYSISDPRTGSSTAIDESLDYSFAWSCDEQQRNLSGNGVPNHSVTGGNFATQLSAQSVSFSFPIAPTLADEVTSVKEPGFAVNSIKFDPATAGTCPDDATDDTNCNYAMGSDTWSMVATAGEVSPWKFEFGVDENDAHVQPNGQYHYHGIPGQLVTKLNPDSENSMTLVGWAKDGFPMYALRGYSEASNSDSSIRKIESSYQLLDTPNENRPDVADFPLGHFVQDWQYVEDSGDLDECNGRFGVTPEFPDGSYHYYITESYPFVQRCVKGEVSADEGDANIGPPAGP